MHRLQDLLKLDVDAGGRTIGRVHVVGEPKCISRSHATFRPAAEGVLDVTFAGKLSFVWSAHRPREWQRFGKGARAVLQNGDCVALEPPRTLRGIFRLQRAGATLPAIRMPRFEDKTDARRGDEEQCTPYNRAISITPSDFPPAAAAPVADAAAAAPAPAPEPEKEKAQVIAPSPASRPAAPADPSSSAACTAPPGDGTLPPPPRRWGLHPPAVRTAPAARKRPAPAPATPSDAHAALTEASLEGETPVEELGDGQNARCRDSRLALSPETTPPLLQVLRGERDSPPPTQQDLQTAAQKELLRIMKQHDVQQSSKLRAGDFHSKENRIKRFLAATGQKWDQVLWDTQFAHGRSYGGSFFKPENAANENGASQQLRENQNESRKRTRRLDAADPARPARRKAERAKRQSHPDNVHRQLTRDLMLREGMGRHKQYCSLPLFHESLAALGAGDFSSKLRAALAAEKKRRAD